MMDVKTLIKLLMLLLTLSSLSSCSLLSSSRAILGGKNTKAPPAKVTKQQYDELLKKYQALLRRNRQLEGEELPQEVQSTSKNLPKLAETVDVFAKQLEKAPQTSSKLTPQVMTGQTQFSARDVEGQIKEIKKAIALISNNRFDESLQILKSLEASRHKQIVVRVKFYMGEILFRQGEYDLAMQVFEEVLSKYAFSGIVLKTLGRLIVCSEKLKIKKKYDLYYSILHDFFKTA